MSSAITKYVVDVDYKLRGLEKSSKALDTTAKHAAKAEGSFISLKNVLLGGLAMRGFGMMKNALIGSNASIESMKIGMATIIGSNFHVPYEKAQVASGQLVEDYRQIAKASPGTTRDFLEMNNSIMSAVTRSGGSLNDLKEITSGAVIASTAFGQRSDLSSLDITQMLTANVTARDRFAKMLIEPFMSVDEYNKKKTPERLSFLKKALGTTQIKAAAKAYGESYEGRMSTLKDTIDHTLQSAGKPFFEWVKQQLDVINKWADANQKKIAKVAKDVGTSLVKGAEAMKDAGLWIYRNRDVLLEVAKAFLFFKGAGMIVGGVTSIVGGMKSLASSANLATIGLAGLAYGLSHWDSGAVGNWLAGRDNTTPGQNSVEDKAEALWQKRNIGNNALAGAVSWDEASAKEKQDLIREVQQGGRADKWNAEKGGYFDDVRNKYGWGAAAAGGFDANTTVKAKSGGKVEVTIKKMEVAADDYDNLLHSIIGGIGRELRIPGQALNMPRGAY